MKKIVLISECLDKGVGRHVTDLYKNLTDEKIEIFVIYGKERSSKSFEDIIDSKHKINIKSLKKNIGINDFRSVFEIKKILLEIKPDVVHCHSSKAGFSGRIAAKLAKVDKIIYSPHAYFFLKFKKKSLKQHIFVLVEKILSKFFTSITITTSKGEDEVFEEYKLDKLNKKILIEHGFKKENIQLSDINKEKQRYGIKENDIVIGTMARFENQKDPITTFNIMKGIKEKYNNVKCIFWGNGSQFEKIYNMNNQYGQPVILPKETDIPDISLNILDIYLTASLYEGLPYTLIQCLAYELPIVASNVVGNKDCVVDEKNGYLFEAGDYKQAIEKIEKIIVNKEIMKKFKEKSLEIYQERFNMQKMIYNYKKIYLGDENE